MEIENQIFKQVPYKVVNDHRSFINPIVLQFVSTSAMQSTPKHDKLPIYKQAFKQLTSLGIIPIDFNNSTKRKTKTFTHILGFKIIRFTINDCH